MDPLDDTLEERENVFRWSVQSEGIILEGEMVDSSIKPPTPSTQSISSGNSLSLTLGDSDPDLTPKEYAHNNPNIGLEQAEALVCHFFPDNHDPCGIASDMVALVPASVSAGNTQCTDGAKVHHSAKERVTIKDILRGLAHYVDWDGPKLVIQTTREDVWSSARQMFVSQDFNATQPLEIRFKAKDTDDPMETAGHEGAVDEGGPCRDFFTLCMEAMQNGPCFIGDNKVLNRSIQALDNQDYLVCGRVIALSLIHGGPPPCFLSPKLYSALVYGPENTSVEIEDLPESAIKVSLRQLTGVRKEEFLSALDHPDHQALAHTIDNAGTLPVLPVQDDMQMEKVISDTVLYYLFSRTADVLQQFKDGLSTLGVLQMIQNNPEIFKECFTWRQFTVTSTYIKDQFNRQDVKGKWQNVLQMWDDLLDNIEAGECDISPKEILFFATGLKVPPAQGFPAGCPKLDFLQGERKDWKFPLACTCSYTLYLPVVHSYYKDFEDNMLFGIKNCKGFGFI